MLATLLLATVVIGNVVTFRSTDVWLAEHHGERWAAITRSDSGDLAVQESVWASGVIRDRRGLYIALSAVAPGATVVMPPSEPLDVDQLIGLAQAAEVRIADYDPRAILPDLPFADIAVASQGSGADDRPPGGFLVVLDEAGPTIPRLLRESGTQIELWEPPDGPPPTLVVSQVDGRVLVISLDLLDPSAIELAP